MDGKVILLNHWEYDHMLLLYELGVKVHPALLSFIRGALKNGESCFFAYDKTQSNLRLEIEFKEEIATGRLQPFYMLGKNPFYEMKDLNSRIHDLRYQVLKEHPTLRIAIDFGEIVTPSVAKDVIECITAILKGGDEYKTVPPGDVKSIIAFNASALPNDVVKVLLAFYRNVIFSTKNEHMTLLLNFRSVETGDLPSVEIVSRKVLERFVKKNLETIVLSMILEHPMCGYDLIRKIYQKHHTFLSQGTLYPLLYDLQREGLIRKLKSANPRSKVYTLTEQGKRDARTKIDDFLLAQRYLLESFKKI